MNELDAVEFSGQAISSSARSTGAHEARRLQGVAGPRGQP